MASEAVIDVEAVCAPIEGDNPAGTDLRADESTTAPYARLMTMRAEARDYERWEEQRSPDDPPEEEKRKPPPWQDISDLAQQVLREKSKDLQIVCWLIEAQVRLEKFAGLRDSLRVAANLVRQYWDSLYSITDEEDPTAKGEPVAGLNGRDRDGALVVALRKVPMTTITATEPYTFYVCEELHRKDRLEEVKAHCRQGPKEFYVNMVDDIVASRAAYGELADLLREKMAEHAPPVSRIAELLESVEEMARRITGITEGGAEGEQAAEGGAAAAGPGGGTVASREQALQTILNIADFFENREPQAPIAATLRDAVRRARMPLQDLLAELLPDEASRNLLLMNAGIRPAPPKTEEQQ